jgi:hypothetical protein
MFDRNTVIGMILSFDATLGYIAQEGAGLFSRPSVGKRLLSMRGESYN